MEARAGDKPQLLDFCSNCRRPLQSFTPTSLDFPPNSQNAESHVQLEKLIDDIDCAVRASFPKPTTKYDAVHVLLLRWEADDLGTSKEIQDLENVFQNLYGFKTESWLIPSMKSYITLNQKILDFQKDKSERDLLILYYGGHGIGGSHSNESIWAATGNGPQLHWSNIQPNLLLADCDVLFIFDCCYASRYDLRSSTMYQGSKEILAACSMEDVTTGVHNNSFTRRLIEELKESWKADEACISSWQLHDRLMGRKSLGDLEYTPRFFGLSNKEYPCIELCPIKERVDQCTGQTGPASQDGQDTTEGVPSLIHSENTVSSRDWYTRDRRVIVSISLDDPTKLPSVMQWKRWLTEKAPENIKSMRTFFRPGDTIQEKSPVTAIATQQNIATFLKDTYVAGDRSYNQRKDVEFLDQFEITTEAMYQSDSTLLLLSLPIPVYKYLRRNPTYRYVGVIRSQNLLQRKRLSRPPSMTENVQEGLTKASRHWWWYKWYLGFSFIGLVWSFLTVRQLGNPAVMLAALFSTVLGALPSLGLLSWEDSSTGLSDANWFPGNPRFLEPELNY